MTEETETETIDPTEAQGMIMTAATGRYYFLFKAYFSENIGQGATERMNEEVVAVYLLKPLLQPIFKRIHLLRH